MTSGSCSGCGGYLGALTRTASGPFRLEDAHPLDVVRERLANGQATQLLLPADAGLEAYPIIRLAPDELSALARGQVIRHRGDPLPAPGPAGLLRIADEAGRLAAMARVDGGRLHPEKVFIVPAA